MKLPSRRGSGENITKSTKIAQGGEAERDRVYIKWEYQNGLSERLLWPEESHSQLTQSGRIKLQNRWYNQNYLGGYSRNEEKCQKEQHFEEHQLVAKKI